MEIYITIAGFVLFGVGWCGGWIAAMKKVKGK